MGTIDAAEVRLTEDEISEFGPRHTVKNPLSMRYSGRIDKEEDRRAAVR